MILSAAVMTRGTKYCILQVKTTHGIVWYGVKHAG